MSGYIITTSGYNSYHVSNLPLDVIYDNRKFLVIKMFESNKCVSILVNFNRKQDRR